MVRDIKRDVFSASNIVRGKGKILGSSKTAIICSV